MLWTLTLDFLNKEEILLGIHMASREDPVYNIPTFSITIGLLFMNISLSFGFKKGEQ